ncbi:MAG: hypothetical protein A3I05_06710 [Deltaproteobacteria bacterium RIFCSPLOWO2_02_FULL_44_10]|nr:MAG: hypothetical protein A3C46_06910 [Deltaproteobacteria bacterium RIFCSPHIGHO2_02_FULL_44_16]OGQ46722.1 MAG: hypothetical protein A3I05_06710 [Deltaproteobacteria bacterium RIFCSPLOWO2_02_FULL_44_10]
MLINSAFVIEVTPFQIGFQKTVFVQCLGDAYFLFLISAIYVMIFLLSNKMVAQKMILSSLATISSWQITLTFKVASR